MDAIQPLEDRVEKQEGRQKLYFKDVEGKCGLLKMAKGEKGGPGSEQKANPFACKDNSLDHGPPFPLMSRIS